MTRVLLFAALLLTVGLSSCQCSEKPDIGPVEGDEEQAEARPAPTDTARRIG